MTENLKKSIDNSLFTCGMFLDFSKAFDIVDHDKTREVWDTRHPPNVVH